MKNLRKWFPLIFVFIFVFTLSSCAEKDKNSKKEEEKPKEVNAPTNIISITEADSIYSNYSNHRVSIIKTYETQERAPEESFEVARYVDFDYKMIKDYLDYVDQEAEKAGVKKVTNLRMYFANYPDEKKFADGEEVVHPRQNSLFLLPTMAADGGNFGFYIGDDGKAKLIKDRKIRTDDGSEKSKASIFPSLSNTLYSNTSLVLNRGGSGPPPFTDF